jgi:hypothetical protein
MNRDLSCAQNVVEWSLVSTDILYLLSQHDITLSFFPGYFAQIVGAGKKAHRPIAQINIVNRKPNRDGLCRPNRPIGRILVPGHTFLIFWQLAKVVAGPADEIFSD